MAAYQDPDYDILSTIIGGIVNAVFGNSEHEENFNKGYKLLEQYSATDEEDFLKAAILEFVAVDDDDFLYLQVAAKYCLAICYAKQLKFDKSYNALEFIQRVDYDFFTRKKNTIETIRESSVELKKEIESAERAYNAYLEQLRREEEERLLREQAEKQRLIGGNGNNDAFWKIVAIISLVLLSITIIGVIFLLFMY